MPVFEEKNGVDFRSKIFVCDDLDLGSFYFLNGKKEAQRSQEDANG